MRVRKIILYGCLLWAGYGCKEVYDAPVQQPNTGYLVVEGVANSGAGGTTLTLTRTTKFSTPAISYEKGATVKIEGDDNSSYALVEKANAQYTIDNLPLNSARKYRLHITTRAGKQYLSDYVGINNNPPIDSISKQKEGDGGLQLFVHTHDPSNNTRYYQWSYDETWQIQSEFVSFLKYQVKKVPTGEQYSVVYRDSATFGYDTTILNCWQYSNSNSILLGSTAKLASDVVYLPLLTIPHSSIKLGVLYSAYVKQYSWTDQGYQFLDRMRKNTEATGSVFDPQPSQLVGNIRSVSDSTEPVIGFFNICPVRDIRIFVYRSEVPWWDYRMYCQTDQMPNNSDTIKVRGLSLIPTSVVEFTLSGGIATFSASSPECVDCTLRGSNKRPAYWPR